MEGLCIALVITFPSNHHKWPDWEAFPHYPYQHHQNFALMIITTVIAIKMSKCQNISAIKMSRVVIIISVLRLAVWAFLATCWQSAFSTEDVDF